MDKEQEWEASLQQWEDLLVNPAWVELRQWVEGRRERCLKRICDELDDVQTNMLRGELKFSLAFDYFIDEKKGLIEDERERVFDE